MEFDYKTSEFVLSPAEWLALGRSTDDLAPEAYRLPVSSAPLLLTDCETQRARLSDIDLAEYPAGATRSDQQAAIVRNHNLLRGMVETVQPHLPSVADGVDAYLHDNQS